MGQTIRERLKVAEERAMAATERADRISALIICEEDETSAYARFGRKVFNLLWTSEWGYFDTDDLMEDAKVAGLIYGIDVSGPCGEDCECCDFPTTCVKARYWPPFTQQIQA